MIEENDWHGVEDFVKNHPEVLTDNITSDNQTIFHYITSYVRHDIEGFACLIENLASKVDPIILEKTSFGLTALDWCAIRGNTRASKIFVKYNPNLPNVRDVNGWIAVQTAAYYGNKDTVQYLVQATADENLKGRSGALLISYLIESNLYDIALDFLKRYPTIGRDGISSRNIILDVLATKPLAFESGSKHGRLQRFIYNCTPVRKESISSFDQANKKQGVDGDVENVMLRLENYSTKPTFFGSLRKVTATFGAMCQKLHKMFWNALVLVPYIKVIREKKLMHIRTVEILRMICKGVAWNDHEIFRTGSLHKAAILGISEFVSEILMAYKRAVNVTDGDECHIFHRAVYHRQEKVFNLIYGFHFLVHMMSRTDKYGNNMLHLAGILVEPPSEIAGAALQMQRELQWFKAVENLMLPADCEKQNFRNKTPREMFTETHKELVKLGEKWMKETASSCTLAVTLIITVVFAAAFTVPGGNNNGGVPILLKDQAFLIFAISDALALFSSTTSLLMFLGILTSRYAEEDFLVSLPRRLILGLITLFFSIASMMVAFSATIYIVLSGFWNWIIIPVSLFACVPVTLFALLQFPLLVDMVLSTYGPSIFRPMK